MTITYQREAIGPIAHELQPLMDAHWREIEEWEDIPLDPDWAWYCTSEFLRCYTARLDGALIGYDAYGVGPDMHHRTSLRAVQDAIFVQPEHRGRAGPGLLWFSREQLKAEGVQVLYRIASRRNPMYGEMLHRMGSTPVETLWAERLDRG